MAAVLCAGIAAAGYTQVDQGELGQNLPPVAFISYEGPHARIDTREQIRQIGAVLGRQIAGPGNILASALTGVSERSIRIEAGAASRYFVIHSVSGQEDGKLDADIFGLGVDAGVDHIRNLRTIIQGYLQTVYGYNERDALLLAEYITVYNAVYRGSWDYFTGRYKTPVVQHIGRDKAGLSIRYDEWPGRTLILIPLGHGGLSSIDTSTISDRRVVEELRKEDDQGVEQRRDMVDLKEREAEQAEQRAQIERETIREEERRIDRERQDIAEERQRAQEDREAGLLTEEDARRRQQELDDREREAAQREQELNQRRDEAQRLDDFAERKTEEAQQDRRDIAADQQAAIIQDTVTGIFAVMIERQNPSMGRLVRLSLAGRELRRSSVDTVYVRTVTFIGGKIIAIAGENRGSGAVRLIEIDQNNLGLAGQGDDDLHSESLLWINGSDIYAITVNLSDNSCYLGRFNANLALQAKSAVKVHAAASVAVQQGRLLTQREDGSALILNPADLTEMTR
ncbi:MAG: hypothetical protein LBG91_05570 [Treponema sp.]|nr:hypothetical protein [Treponema sp.]